MNNSQDLDPFVNPSDPEEIPTQPPLSGTVDDADDVDDEREDENEAPVRAASDGTDARDEFRLDEREEDPEDDLNVDDDKDE